jgi:four helix bundle protein
MADYRRLKVWEIAHRNVLDVYAVTARFPAPERYGLTAQLRRAVISVPSNIAEGTGRRGDGDFKRFLAIALGSNLEFEYQLLVSRDLGFLSEADHQKIAGQVASVSRMLNALMARLEKGSRKGGVDKKRAA